MDLLRHVDGRPAHLEVQGTKTAQALQGELTRTYSTKLIHDFSVSHCHPYHCADHQHLSCDCTHRGQSSGMFAYLSFLFVRVVYLIWFFPPDWVSLLNSLHGLWSHHVPAICPLWIRLQVHGQTDFLPAGPTYLANIHFIKFHFQLMLQIAPPCGITDYAQWIVTIDQYWNCDYESV